MSTIESLPSSIVDQKIVEVSDSELRSILEGVFNTRRSVCVSVGGTSWSSVNDCMDALSNLPDYERIKEQARLVKRFSPSS